MRVTVLAGVTALALAVTSCGESDESTTDPSDGPTSDIARADVFDPCDLIPREHLEELDLIPADAALFNGLSRGREQIIDCRISTEETFSFGYRGGLVGPDARDLLTLEPMDEVTTLAGLGDLALIADRGTAGTSIAIDIGDEQLFLRAAAAFNLTIDDLTGLAHTMVENLPETLGFDPVVLPEGCPAPDAAIVSDLTGGPVIQARGVENVNTVALSCRYLTGDAVQLTIDMERFSPDAADVHRRIIDSDDSFEVGRVTFYVTDEQPGLDITVQAVTEHDDLIHVHVSAPFGEDIEGISTQNIEELIRSLAVLSQD